MKKDTQVIKIQLHQRSLFVLGWNIKKTRWYPTSSKKKVNTEYALSSCQAFAYIIIFNPPNNTTILEYVLFSELLWAAENYVPKNSCRSSNPPVPQNVTTCGGRVFKEVTKLKWAVLCIPWWGNGGRHLRLLYFPLPIHFFTLAAGFETGETKEKRFCDSTLGFLDWEMGHLTKKKNARFSIFKQLEDNKYVTWKVYWI